MKLTGSKGEIVAAAIAVGKALADMQDPEGGLPIPPGPEGDAFCKAFDDLQVALIAVDTRVSTPKWRERFMKRLQPFCRAPKESRSRLSLRK